MKSEDEERANILFFGMILVLSGFLIWLLWADPTKAYYVSETHTTTEKIFDGDPGQGYCITQTFKALATGTTTISYYANMNDPNGVTLNVKISEPTSTENLADDIDCNTMATKTLIGNHILTDTKTLFTSSSTYLEVDKYYKIAL